MLQNFLQNPFSSLYMDLFKNSSNTFVCSFWSDSCRNYFIDSSRFYFSWNSSRISFLPSQRVPPGISQRYLQKLLQKLLRKLLLTTLSRNLFRVLPKNVFEISIGISRNSLKIVNPVFCVISRSTFVILGGSLWLNLQSNFYRNLWKYSFENL